jgi:DNA polymerase-1
VHDEILIEAPVNEEEKVKELLSVCMQEAAELSVKLQVSVTSGKNWYDCK